MARYILLLLLIGNYSFLLAENTLPGKVKNGCGTEGIQGVLVPDSTIFSKCKFNTACNKHDICYGRCLEGGDLYGKEICNDPVAKEERRKVCDTDFFTNIISDNNDRGICKFYGKFYRFAVVKFGKGNFNGRDIEEIARGSFNKGELEAVQFYENLSIIQKSQYSPQSLSIDNASSLLILKQKNFELKFSENQMKSLANKANALSR